MLQGSCLCNGIQYQLSSSVDTLVFCHCSRCRKQTGSAFNTATLIKKEHFTITQGKEKLKMFSHQGVNRHFCVDCGSHLLSSRDNDPNYYRLRIGTLSDDIYPKNKMHIYVGSKANWDEINDNYPQFEALPE